MGDRAEEVRRGGGHVFMRVGRHGMARVG
jgi:hypothetical protein